MVSYAPDHSPRFLEISIARGTPSVSRRGYSFARTVRYGHVYDNPFPLFHLPLSLLGLRHVLVLKTILSIALQDFCSTTYTVTTPTRLPPSLVGERSVELSLCAKPHFDLLFVRLADL